jgi:hypothetical protein
MGTTAPKLLVCKAACGAHRQETKEHTLGQHAQLLLSAWKTGDDND